jgi:PKD repeat protein
MIKDVTMRSLLGSTAFFIACTIPSVTSAQTRTIRVVTYNIEDDVGTTTPLPGLIAPSSGGSVTNGGVLEGIGEEILGGDPAQPLDILALQETTSNGTTVQPIVNGLNVFYSTRGISAGYAMSPVQGSQVGGNTSGNGPNALVYNTNTLQLIASVGVGTPHGSLNGEYRQVMRYEFAPAGVTPTTTNEFYVYVSHYKSGTNSTDLTARQGEAVIIRNDEATSLPASARVLYVGDYNISGSGEASYLTILSNSAPNGVAQGGGIDPKNVSVNTNINWTTSASLFLKTESATILHYRDDFQVMTSNVFHGVAGGLALVSGTYHVFGNDGSTPYLGSVNDGSNSSLSDDLNTNVTGISATQLYQYLTTASDHLPVVADYTIPVPSSAPVASFNGSPVSGVAPLAVTFTDASSGSVTVWSWNFGDGGTTNLATNTVLYTYNTAGVYSVTEIVSGPGGSSTNTQVNYITAWTPFQAWQVQYFGSITNPAAGANADPDGDGQNNLAEFLAGTNPTNSASGLRINSITAQGSDVRVTWATAGGETDVVQATAGLPDGSYSTNFLDLSPVIIIPGSGDATTNYLDSGGATNIPARFYRVRLVP